ncbi:MAG TPA: hypothetical protein DCY20_05575 [Firmicutes bacterium]|nr:hypothetical protein [Bacillota bacterium]
MDIDVYTCEQCGGDMIFDIKVQALKCPYCEHVCEIGGQEQVKEYNFSEVSQLEFKSNWNDEVEVINCESCGAQTVIGRDQTAICCSYCGSSHVLKTKQSAGIKPEGVIPFKIETYQAQDIMQTWFKKRWLAPNNLKLLYQSEKMTGVYVPYWTYDADTFSTYSGQGGRYYYETREVNGKRQQIRKVRWYPVKGQINRFFDDVLVNGSKHFNDSLMNGIEPFNTVTDLEAYAPQYLAGYVAEKYSYGVKESFEVAKQKMNSEIENDAEEEILSRYDTVRRVSVKTQYHHVTFKHVLLPVYHATYTYQGKNYEYMINGESGKISGTYPYSWVKITFLVLIGVAGLILIMYVMNH